MPNPTVKSYGRDPRFTVATSTGSAAGKANINHSHSYLDTTVNTYTPAVTSDLTLTTTASIHLIDATVGSLTAHLPDASAVSSRIVMVKKVDSTNAVITVSTAGADLFDGLAITLENQYDYILAISNGTNWFIIGGAIWTHHDMQSISAAPAAGVYDLNSRHSIHLIDATAGNIEARLPVAVNTPRRVMTVKKTDATANTVTVTLAASGGPDGAAVVLSSQYAFVTSVSDGTVWHRIS